jgi:mono/diheme cytochrome c family protein
MRVQTRILFLAAAFLVTAAFAQGEGSVERGKKIFFDTGPEEYPDYPSCAHCHTTLPADKEKEKTGQKRPAHSLYNVSARPSFKNKPKGKGPKTAGDAGNICVRAFQKRPKALPPEGVADLNAYLKSVSPGKSAKPLKIGYAPKLMTELDGGDPKKGKEEYEEHCTICHGDEDESIYVALKAGRWDKTKVLRKVRGYIVDKKTKKVRFKANNGMMSFFAMDRLSDAALRDILAYLGKKK